MHVLIWLIENQQYAVDLNKIERIILAAETTRLPNAPEYILGAINIHGEVIPVINMRKILQIAPKEVAVQDHFILCYVHEKKMALWVDAVKQVKKCDENSLIPSDLILKEGPPAHYVLKEEDIITLFYDFDYLLPEKDLATIT